MIKGINRQVIEINETGSVYYERAWFIVKPAYAQMHNSILEREAQSILRNIDAPSSMKSKRNRSFWLVRMGISALMGAGLCFLCQMIF